MLPRPRADSLTNNKENEVTKDEMRVAFAAAAYQAILTAKLSNTGQQPPNFYEMCASQAWLAAQVMLEKSPDGSAPYAPEHSIV